MPAADSRSRSSSPYAVEQMAVNFNRSRFGTWWRWRSELAYALALAGSYFYGWWRLGSWLWPLLILAGLTAPRSLLRREKMGSGCARTA